MVLLPGGGCSLRQAFAHVPLKPIESPRALSCFVIKWTYLLSFHFPLSKHSGTASRANISVTQGHKHSSAAERLAAAAAGVKC